MYSVPEKKIKMDPMNGEQSDRGGQSESSSNKGSRSTNNSDGSDSVRNMGQVLQNAIDVKDLFAPPQQDSPLHILNALCNDLLDDVFKRLHLLDLLNVAKVCVRFQSQAHAAFASKYKHLELNDEECGHDKTKMVLCEFGPFIQSIRVASNKHPADGDLFRAIIQNCTPKLKVLRLSKLNIQVDSPDFRLPFPELQELELSLCVGNYSLAHLIDDCPELVKIDLFWGQAQGANELISRKFKKLERLYLRVYIISDAALERFITLNPGLIELTVDSNSHLQTSRAIRLIGQNLLGLKKLDFTERIRSCDQFQSDVQHIGNLRSLSSLRLNFNRLKAVPLAKILVANNLPIEEFGMVDASDNDDTIKWILQMKQIKALKFFRADDINDENLVALARGLPELQKLHVIGKVSYWPDIDNIIRMIDHAKKLSHFRLSVRYGTDYVIGLFDYNAMLEAIQNRPEKIGLRFEVEKPIFVPVPKDILQKNHEILSVINQWWDTSNKQTKQ